MSLYKNLESLRDHIIQDPDPDFSRKAAKHLEKWELKKPLEETEVFDLALTQKLPRQIYSEGGFGAFNLTLFNSEDFNLQLYVMENIPTEIHDHAFDGAFKVLSGKNLHTTFSFAEEKELEANMVYKGRLTVNEAKLLELNQVARIDEGLIHQLHRIEKKNITLLVSKKMRSANSFYLYPSLRINNPMDNFASLRRGTQALMRILESKPKSFELKAKPYLKSLKISELIALATRLGGSNFGFLRNEKGHLGALHALVEAEFARRHLGEELSAHGQFLRTREAKALKLA